MEENDLFYAGICTIVAAVLYLVADITHFSTGHFSYGTILSFLGSIAWIFSGLFAIGVI